MKWHAMLAAIAVTRSYKPGWAAYKYRERFGGWPPVRIIKPIEPSTEILSWVRSRAIAYAKAKKRAA
jgi:DNA repair protein RadD